MRMLALCLFTLCLVGCSSGSSSRQYNVGFDQAEPKLRKLYPPILVGQAGNATLLNIDQAQHAKFVGPVVTVRRDELYDSPQVQIVIVEGADSADRRTKIMLTSGPSSNECTVDVVASKSKKSVVFPSRDKEFEAAILDDIAAALK